MVYKFFLNSMINALLPVSCGLCNAKTGSSLPLCSACLNDLVQTEQPCKSCALPLPGTQNSTICGSCQQQTPICDGIQALFLYQKPLSILIQQFKFNRKLEYSNLFSHLMAAKLKSSHYQPDLLIPVPLHASRLRERGFNQSWEITRQLAKHCGIAANYKTCQRIKKTPLQTGLSAAKRKQNLKQAFDIKLDVNNLHVCIIDDVMTTGSTLDAIALALKAAGAAKVSGLVVARVVL